MTECATKIEPDAAKPVRLAPSAVRYIKLGAGGAWEASSLDQGRIEWGDARDPFDLAAAGDWTAARQHYLDAGFVPSTATSYVRELRDFHELGSDALWITFARGYLWWAFAEPELIIRDEESPAQGRAYRRTIGPWRNTSVGGRPLPSSSLSTSLTKVSAYQRTMCGVSDEAYLLRILNDEPDPALARAIAARSEMADAILPLIQKLHQDDFELFVDLLFTRLGWRRISTLGGTMKDIDLMLELPATGAIASVQVKSTVNQAVINRCAASFADGSPADAFYLVTHSPASALTVPESTKPFHIWSGTDLAERCIATGMSDWLLARG